jgi:hypothetical protein
MMMMMIRMEPIFISWMSSPATIKIKFSYDVKE